MPRTSKPSSSDRPRWHWIITITWGVRDVETVTATGTVAPLPGKTRQEMFDFLYDRTVRQANAQEAFVLFFSLEPDALRHGAEQRL
ncbi:hypothetical protein GCM10009837_23210 [Streptomyces durmitorensis]|uniref:Uncharacterized protein n=1 Tax=Streptomyces durmitorensis TaxID=319947 RepID=A0ABY4PNT2_9ACTN|nr:hypothetical protein [Streptomyces durmitorensis]UQT55055.1 hypothetical protein M4V62_08070 [Streptomyces durmitorensis]